MDAELRRIAERVVTELTTGPPTLGAGYALCVDGPAGSGKTTLARAIAELVPDAEVLHCDEMLEGWRGLPGLAASVETLLRSMSSVGIGEWRRWDWLAYDWAETHYIRCGGLLVLEGVGSWSPGIADLIGGLVWVEAAPDLRLARGLERDGEAMRPHWEQWRLDEDALFERLGTRAHADVVVTTD